MEKTESIKVKESSSSNKNKSKYVLEFITEKIFMISALMAVISLLLIIGFVFYKGLMPFVSEGYSFIDFIFGTEWLPSSKEFGIGAMIVTSMVATVGALIIGVPIGILAAIFIAEICPKKYAKSNFNSSRTFSRYTISTLRYIWFSSNSSSHTNSIKPS